MNIRKASVAGAFYPEEKGELKSMIAGFLKEVPTQHLSGELKAVIVPHAGYEYSGQIAAYAYSLIAKTGAKKVVLLGPSHYLYFFGIAADANTHWETPLGKTALTKNNVQKIPQAHVQEHSLEVQLPFLQSVLKDFEILPILAGDEDPKDIAEQVKPLISDALLVISSDLSHYHNYESAKRLDIAACRAVEKLDLKSLESSEACGRIPIMAAVNLAKDFGWKSKLLCYKNSGDVTKDRSKVVGYASFAFYK
jgi:MEMO1 family protein